jgi:hypothetical protein
MCSFTGSHEKIRGSRSEDLGDSFGESFGDLGEGGDLLDACLREFFERSETLNERLFALWPYPRDFVKAGGKASAGAQAAVICDREPVRLIANMTQQQQGLAPCREQGWA